LRMNCTDRNGMLKDVVHDLDSALSGWHWGKGQASVRQKRRQWEIRYVIWRGGRGTYGAFVRFKRITMTEVCPCFFLTCKANARVYLAKT
jgi:hypothetical protein